MRLAGKAAGAKTARHLPGPPSAAGTPLSSPFPLKMLVGLLNLPEALPSSSEILLPVSVLLPLSQKPPSPGVGLRLTTGVCTSHIYKESSPPPSPLKLAAWSPSVVSEDPGTRVSFATCHLCALVQAPASLWPVLFLRLTAVCFSACSWQPQREASVSKPEHVGALQRLPQMLVWASLHSGLLLSCSLSGPSVPASGCSRALPNSLLPQGLCTSYREPQAGPGLGFMQAVAQILLACSGFPGPLPVVLWVPPRLPSQHLVFPDLMLCDRSFARVPLECEQDQLGSTASLGTLLSHTHVFRFVRPGTQPGPSTRRGPVSVS